jgi:HEAT repeat protein
MRQLDVRVDAALRAIEQDCRWDLINGIVGECPDDVLPLSIDLLNAADEGRRTLGADILGRLAGAEPSTHDTVVKALSEALCAETADTAIASIVAAIGHVGDGPGLSLVLPYAGHPCAEVRLAVAFAVATIGAELAAPETREILIRLSRDEECEVRDWATFGLGTLTAADGPDVRAALLARAEDSSHQTRAEALFGLAVRRDPRAVPHLIRALSSPQVDGLEVDAAAAAADPRLLPALWALRLSGAADEARVRNAIDRCSGSDRPSLPS